MKRNFVAITLIALFFSMALTGCEKENVNPKSKSVSELAPELQDLYKQMPTHDYGNITVIDGNILCFETKEQYEKVANILLDDCKKWNKLFYDKYSSMDGHELADWEEEIGYDEFFPLKKFEEQFGVFGEMLFDEQESLLSNWMENGLEGPDPTDDIFNLESDQAMFNPNHEICVDDTIYQFREGALVVVPVSQLNDWRKHRYSSLEDIMELYTVLKDSEAKPGDDDQNYGNNLSDMPTHHNFICKTPNTDLKSTDFSAITGVYDKSVWSLVGRRGLTLSHVVTYKLVNYEFVKFKNNGQPKYRKISRKCSMVPHISLSTEVYEQFYQSFFYWEKFDGYQNEELPNNQTVKTFSDKLPYQHLPIDYLSKDYHFGIFTDNATVLIRFDEDTQSFPIVFE